MPWARGDALEAHKSVEPDEKAELNGNNDLDEATDEEVEYEEVEEDEEVEEIEEEEEVEEEVEEEEEGSNAANENGGQKSLDGNEDMEDDGDAKEKHAELLALPPHGSEVYVGGLPADASKEDLRSVCESIGEVTEVRIMKDKDSGGNKGFAFVTFRNEELASKAMDKLNKSELKGKKLKCSTSQAKNRLFIGNVPRDWGDDDLKKAVMDVGPGVTSVVLVKDVKNTSNNRGFAFIEYYNHACAEYSRKKMMNPKFELGGNALTVSWADPKSSDSSAALQVKAVYVSNLPKNVTDDQIKKLFEHHGRITKIVLPPAKAGKEKSRIAFVHFAERLSAMKALKKTEKYELDGQVLECSLAKPQADQKAIGVSNSEKPGLISNYPPLIGYGLAGGAYGAFSAGYGPAGFAQPLIYGRRPTPPGMAMMPLLLPDGRIGYVLQQPGAQPHNPPVQQRGGGQGGRGSSSRSGGSGRGKDNGDSSQGHRYRPY
ncbi:RNA recognition motif domain [Dillenia turbinata]|uniref:RNA recognition motif domain n=1 Tax=Dillenia turbinata TaxID=194707 RepID=A0AAN8V802_9MAGN